MKTKYNEKTKDNEKTNPKTENSMKNKNTMKKNMKKIFENRNSKTQTKYYEQK